MRPKWVKVFMQKIPVLAVFSVCYFTFGVFYPVKMQYINFILMSLVDMLMLTVHNGLMTAINFVRSL